MQFCLPLRQCRAAVLAVPFLLLSACDAASDDESWKDDVPDHGDPVQIYRIDDVQFAVLESYPLQLHITANGHARTGGWTEPYLFFDEELSDTDTLVYHFMATPPEGMATQAHTPISAAIIYRPFDPNVVTEVTIIAATNELTVPINGGGD